MTPSARGDESGQLTILIIGYTVLCLLIAGVVMGVSAVHIEHKKLVSAADGAAKAAADSFTIADTTQEGGSPAAELGAERVRMAVNRYLDQDETRSRFERFAIESATGSPDGRSAHVTLSAVARLPLVGGLFEDGVQIRATSTARARLSR